MSIVRLDAPYPKGGRIEVSFAFGPIAEGNVANGSWDALFGDRWRLNRDAGEITVFHFNELNMTYEDVTSTLITPIPNFARNADKSVSFCFDTAARITFAWENTNISNRGVYLQRYNNNTNSYEVLGPYQGVDSVIFNDAEVSYSTDDNNILLFYMSEDRLSLRYRKQEDNYLIEYIAETYSQPLYIINAERYPYQYGIGLSPIPPDPRDPNLVQPDRYYYSDFYPVRDKLHTMVGNAFLSVLMYKLNLRNYPTSDSMSGNAFVNVIKYVNKQRNYLDANRDIILSGQAFINKMRHINAFREVFQDEDVIVLNDLPALVGDIVYPIVSTNFFDFDDDRIINTINLQSVYHISILYNYFAPGLEIMIGDGQLSKIRHRDKATFYNETNTIVGEGSLTRLKYKSTILNPPEVTPNTVQGLVLWLRPESLSAQINGSEVNTWLDESGLRNDAISPQNGQKPTYRTNIYNTKSAVRFDGNDFEMSELQIPSDFTIMIYFTVTDTITQPMTIFGSHNFGNDGQPNGKVVIDVLSDGSLRVGDDGTYQVSSAGRISQNVDYVLTYMRQGGTTNLFLNRLSVSLTNYTGSVSFTNTNFFKGYIPEIVVFDRKILISEKGALESYFINKYLTIPTTNMIAWFDASTISQNDNTPITVWSSRHNSSVQLQQSVLGVQPIIKEAIINGNKVVRFDGINDFLQTNNPINYSGAFTIFVVATPAPLQGAYLISSNQADGAPAIISGFAASTPTNASYEWWNGGSSDRKTIGVGTETGFNILTVQRRDTPTTNLVTRLNGISSFNGATSSNIANKNISFVGKSDINANYFGGDIVEIIAYDRYLNSNEVFSIENYLKNRYNIFPVGNPPLFYDDFESYSVGSGLPSAYSVTFTNPNPNIKDIVSIDGEKALYLSPTTNNSEFILKINDIILKDGSIRYRFKYNSSGGVHFGIGVRQPNGLGAEIFNAFGSQKIMLGSTGETTVESLSGHTNNVIFEHEIFIKDNLFTVFLIENGIRVQMLYRNTLNTMPGEVRIAVVGFSYNLYIYEIGVYEKSSPEIQNNFDPDLTAFAINATYTNWQQSRDSGSGSDGTYDLPTIVNSPVLNNSKAIRTQKNSASGRNNYWLRDVFLKDLEYSFHVHHISGTFVQHEILSRYSGETATNGGIRFRYTQNNSTLEIYEYNPANPPGAFGSSSISGINFSNGVDYFIKVRVQGDLAQIWAFDADEITLKGTTQLKLIYNVPAGLLANCNHSANAIMEVNRQNVISVQSSFKDDFSSYSVGTSPAGYNMIVFSGSPSMAIALDGSNKALALSNSGIGYITNPSFGDFLEGTIRMKFRYTGSDCQDGIEVRYDSTNRFVVGINSSSGVLFVFTEQSGVQQFTNTSVTLNNSNVYELILYRKHNRLQATLITGNTIVGRVDRISNATNAGQIRFYYDSDTTSYFYEYEVTN